MERQGGKPRRRILRWVLGGVFLIVLAGMGAFLALYYSVNIPDANSAATAQANIYQLSNGQVIARTGQINRQKVELDQVPLPVQHAFVAAENKTFYTDSGVDLKGMARGVYNTLSGKGTQGGSTITQQYVKNYYLEQNQTVSRKAKELIISLKVDQDVSKSQILDGYLNTCYFGRGAYGIQAAAQAYYGIDAGKLTVEQGAYLAALVQAPSEYDMAVADPTEKQLALARWHYVLNNMVGMKWLTPQALAKATFQQPIKPKPAPGLTGQNSYLVTLAQDELNASGELPTAQLAAGGYTVTLSIDPAKQKDLLAAVKTQVTDRLNTKLRPKDANAQVGAASVDPSTGYIVALYGGVGPPQHYEPNETRADYQVASTFKPVELASALENKATDQAGQPITANTVYSGKSGRPVVGTSVPFAPPNEDGANYGDITVQKAMDDSVNSVFAQLAVDVGLDKVANTAVSLGMPADTPDLREGPAIALGTMGASPLTMAGIYATFDNHGVKVTPTIVKSVVRAGQKVALKNPIGSQVISRDTADSVTSVLTGVVNSGTGTAARQPSQVAGKTGTSDNNKSAWFTGYTPDLVTSVGMFGQDAKTNAQVPLTGTGSPDPQFRVNGGGYPAQIWGQYTHAALESRPPRKFDLETDQGDAVAPPPSPSVSVSAPASSAPPSTPPSSPPPSLPPSSPPVSPPVSGSPPPGQPTGPPSPSTSLSPGTTQPQYRQAQRATRSGSATP
ncbi:transglycosylase domain-containing protein [Streptomyces sp. SL13]|uniref:Transglycosylase domain-containing protein n=1 Tax=Streptantibioticus silvisoli TaxID=2705255 RepID=A0AA90H3E9_9ACTN|nr:transglycosylase domain-containing protein [Streptantibioticus silvisoli]MDI5964013.1 transglycosylase domain-containing protein [Streptantibioticus silvisoli]MDI5970024.1 transglycosylase domain-containing protein [Streptantibioticus silvisoli]